MEPVRGRLALQRPVLLAVVQQALELGEIRRGVALLRRELELIHDLNLCWLFLGLLANLANFERPVLGCIEADFYK